MNDLYDERPSLRDRLPVLIPVALIALVALGNVLFALVTILPEWETHGTMQTQVALSQLALDATAQSLQDAEAVLQAQVAGVQDDLHKRATIFLTSAQADNMLDKLYRYAQNSRVDIIDLQLVPEAAELETRAYERKTFRLRIDGAPRNLIDFMVRIKEAKVPGVVFTNIAIIEGDALTSLLMDIVLYISPYASGDSLTGIPDQAISTPDVPTPTHMPFQSPTPTPSLTPSPTSTAMATPTPTVVLSATPTVVLSPSPSPLPDWDILAPGKYNDDNPALRYVSPAWIQMASYQGTEGSYHYSADPKAEMSFAFAGSHVALYYVAFQNFGIFEVYVDGVYWTEVDSYASGGTFGRAVMIRGLPYATHVVTVRNTGRRNSASSGAVIAIDAVEVYEVAAPTATPALETLGRDSR